MDAMIDFIFRSKLFRCEAFVDDAEFPCYIFIILQDQELIAEFGNDLTLKTDFDTLLPRKDDYPKLLELYNAVFPVIRSSAVFQKAKEKWQSRKKNARLL